MSINNNNKYKKWANKNTSDKCRRRADTVLRNRYKQEWKEALIEAVKEGKYVQVERRADTVIRSKYKSEWKIEHEKHAKLIGYDTMNMKSMRAIEREQARLAERKKNLVG